MKTICHLYVDGRPICFKRVSAYEFVSLSGHTGQVGTALCFDSMTVRSPSGKEFTVTAKYLGRPVSVCLKREGQPDSWFGLASQAEVAATNSAREEAKV